LIVHADYRFHHEPAPMFKFIHAADLHLDSPLRGLDKYEGAPVEAIRGATRCAFANLVRLAIAERVAFVVLAGDIYDGDWPDYNTGLFFVNELRQLDKAGIPVVWLRGNHDAESRITRSLTLPANSHELPVDRPATIKFDALRVALHGQGYPTPAETRNLAAAYPAPVPGYFNIGVLHTALDGRGGHRRYAPCTVEELADRRGYHYWALGHVHKRCSENGDRQPRIEFPGNIQGRDIGETGPKGCLLVTVDSNQRATTEFRALDVFRWEVIHVDAAICTSLDDALDSAVRAIGDAREQAEGRPIAARLLVSCGDAVHLTIANNLERFRFDLAGQFSADVWVEKIKLRRMDEKRGDVSVITGDAASELRAVLTELQADAGAARDIFAAGDCGKLAKLLPPEIRFVHALSDDNANERCDIFASNLDEIFRQAETLLGSGNHGEDDQ
jgi:DNA repair exonuclease SbcCD nuclease subunit